MDRARTSGGGCVPVLPGALIMKKLSVVKDLPHVFPELADLKGEVSLTENYIYDQQPKVLQQES